VPLPAARMTATSDMARDPNRSRRRDAPVPRDSQGRDPLAPPRTAPGPTPGPAGARADLRPGPPRGSPRSARSPPGAALAPSGGRKAAGDLRQRGRVGGPRPGGPGYPGAPRLAPTRGPAEPQHHAHASTHRQRPRLPGQGIPQARALRVLSPRHRPDAQHRQPLLAGGRDEEGGVLRRRPADAGAQQPRDRVPRPDPHRPGPHHAGAVRQHARGDPPHRQEAGRAAGRDGHPLRGQPPLRPRGAGPDQAVRDLRLGGGPLPVQAGRRARGADRHGARAAARGADPRGGAGALDRRASPRRPQVDGRALPGRDPALDRRAGRRARPAARGAVLPALPRRQPHRRRAAGPQVRPRRPADLDPAVRPDRQRRRRCRREQAGAPPAAPATEPRPGPASPTTAWRPSSSS
jgi:translation initiation factor IF-2